MRLVGSAARSRLCVLGGAALVPLVLASAPLLAEPIVAQPGSVVRWAAPGTEECRLEARTWRPHGDTCYFPVDLERSGEMTIARRRAGDLETASVTIGDYPYRVQHIRLRDTSRVHLSPEDLARAREERLRIDALWQREGPARFSLPLGSPLDEMLAQGSFGAKRVYNGEPRSPHGGEDYRAEAGTPVKAVAAGTVALAEEHFFGGRSVFIDHGGGLVSVYLHLDHMKVAADQEVAPGEVIGTVGSTGRATGPHLHFGVRWHGARIDPAFLLPAE